MINSGKVKQYAELTSKKREVQKMLDDLNGTLAKLEEELLEEYTDEGVSSLKVDTSEGRFTVFPRRELWAGREEGVDNDAACAALRAAGLDDLCETKFNTQKLSAVVREMDAAGAPYPASFVGVIKVTEKYRLSVRKAGNG